MIPEQSLLRSWPGIDPETVVPMHQGDNNLAYRIESQQGTFVLKILLNVTNHVCLAAQHRLLARLQDMELGFAVPAPFPTGDGATVIAGDDDPSRSGILLPYIPGSHPNVQDDRHIAVFATALGLLHRALALIPDPASYTCGLRVAAFSTKSSQYDSPEAMIVALGLSTSLTSDLVRVYATLQTRLATISDVPPAQLLHADLYPSNVLIDKGMVSGFLDFEFMSVGPRSYDVALGLWAFVLWPGDDHTDWQRAETFLAAYSSAVSLVQEEWRDLADFIVIQEAHAFLHWCGRFLSGLTSGPDFEIRAKRLIDIHRWVGRNRGKLEDLIGRVATSV